MEKAMFEKHSEHGYGLLLEGVEMKPVVYGEKTLMAKFLLHKGFSLPQHSHIHEQTGYLVEGHIRLTIDGEVHDVRPGDSWCIPGNVEHMAEFVDDSVAIEVFSPVREDYLPGGNSRSKGK
jgi:quercetin dioxygenase-like cupin family protein